jgi:excinuclease ABC subunit C
MLAACDFLEGQCQEMKAQLDLEMRKAAAAHEYEKAADLRDLIRDLERTTKKEKSFERVPYSLPMSLDPERDLAELANALDLSAPPQRIEGFDISNISGTFVVASLVSFKNGRPDRANYRRFKMKTVVGQDDFASMAEVVRRRYTRVLNETKVRSPKSEVRSATETVEEKDSGGSPIPQELQKLVDETSARVRRERKGSESRLQAATDRLKPELQTNLPDLILIDGGKGQLNAACAELASLGLSHIPVIGLAKEFEEIYRPGESEPLRLGLDHPAVKLLQRVRDESHRVANSYNAQLRIKRISESILDEFPGIGGQRKAALLKKFGSVQRLRTATLEQIAAVPRFGGKAAAELKKFLEARSTLAGQ